MPDKTNLSSCVSKTQTDDVNAIVKAKLKSGLTGCKDQPIASKEFNFGNKI